MSNVTTFIIAFSAVFGTAEAIRNTQSQARRKEHRSRKNNLLVHCPKSSQYSPVLEGRQIVLSGDKLYIDTGKSLTLPFGHPFAGYFLPYPDTIYSGLVSTISDADPPFMNWIYVDRYTHEVKFGNRTASEPHFQGPFDCTRQDRRLIFGGWEGFSGVKDKESSFWELYFDVDGDGLGEVLGGEEGKDGKEVVEVQLRRVEMRVERPKIPGPGETGSTAAEGKKGNEGKGQADDDSEGEHGDGDTGDEEEEEEEPSEDEEYGDEVVLESPEVD